MGEDHENEITRKPKTNTRKSDKKKKGEMQVPEFQSDNVIDFADKNVQSIHAKLRHYKFETNDDEDLNEIHEVRRLENGSQYQGEWDEDNNQPSGKGILVLTDGSLYEGYFVNGECEGQGRIIRYNGDVYEGDWKQGQAHGKGTYTTADGQKYVGDWSKDLKHGKGTETWADGTKYEGDYKKGNIA